MAAQDLLRAAARAAGWAAEYEVRGFGWIADVLCTNGNSLVALEDQLVDNRTLVDRTENYRRSGVRTAWFTPKLRRRKISRLIGTILIFDVDEIDIVVPQLLATSREPIPRTVESVRRCGGCLCPISTVSTFWCWSCWFKFTTPSSGQLTHPRIHLTDWNRKREIAQALWQDKMKTLERERYFAEQAEAHKGTRLSGAARFDGSR
jgi:hypothetical protein